MDTQPKTVETPKLNYSQTKRFALHLFGPRARVWHRNPDPANHVEIGVDNWEAGKVIYGSGPDFYTALQNAITIVFPPPVELVPAEAEGEPVHTSGYLEPVKE